MTRPPDPDRRTRRRFARRVLLMLLPLAIAASGALTGPAAASPAAPVPAAARAAGTAGSSGAPVTPAVPTPPPGGIGVGPPLPASTASSGGGASVPGGGQGSPGLFDITGHITAAIDSWFKDLVTSALNPVLHLLGHSLLATPNLTAQGRIAGLWQTAAGIADSLLVLLVLAGGAIVMSHETLQTRTAAKDVAPRIVVAALAANASLALAGQGIHLANALSRALLGQGVDPAGTVQVLTGLVVGSLADGGIFLVLLGGVVAVLAVVLLATYVIRLALLVVLVVAAPLALVCHALPQTDGLARLWWRAFAGCLAVQVGQSLVLITALRVFTGTGGRANLGLGSSGGLVDLLVAACLCWVLVKIPAWVGRAVFGGHGGGLVKVARDTLVYKAVRAAKNAGTAAVAA